MDWSSVGAALAQIGLTGLGTAFGGPLGGEIGNALGKVVADKLGVDPSPAAIAQAISADPELAKAQLADLESARQADVAMAKIEADSSASARLMQQAAMEQHSLQESTPTILAYLNFGLTAIVVMSLIYLSATGKSVDLAPGLRELLTLILGIQLGCLKDSQAFFYGTSRSSERNGAAVRAIAASANSPSPAQIAGQAIGAAVSQAAKR